MKHAACFALGVVVGIVIAASGAAGWLAVKYGRETRQRW
jgi:hypothetical protein